MTQIELMILVYSIVYHLFKVFTIEHLTFVFALRRIDIILDLFFLCLSILLILWSNDVCVVFLANNGSTVSHIETKNLAFVNKNTNNR